MLEEVEVDLANGKALVGVGIGGGRHQIHDNALFGQLGGNELYELGVGHQVGDALDGHGFLGDDSHRGKGEGQRQNGDEKTCDAIVLHGILPFIHTVVVGVHVTIAV